MPNWFLVGVGLLAGWLALRTLRAIERQTRYTRRSAETFINKERSRLFVRGEISEDFLAGFYAENKGPSPAKVTYGFAGCEILDPNGSLPEVPDYTAGDEPWVFARTDWILPDRECRIGNYDAGYIDPDSNPELFQRVMSRKAKVWFYGVVRYRDSVSDRGHEVRFCYEMLAHDDGRLSLLPNGPDTYRREK
jgi:hypothetical protein